MSNILRLMINFKIVNDDDIKKIPKFDLTTGTELGFAENV